MLIHYVDANTFKFTENVCLSRWLAWHIIWLAYQSQFCFIPVEKIFTFPEDWFGTYMVGMSKPVLFNPGRLHNSWTICIKTRCNKWNIWTVMQVLWILKLEQYFVLIFRTMDQARSQDRFWGCRTLKKWTFWNQKSGHFKPHPQPSTQKPHFWPIWLKVDLLADLGVYHPPLWCAMDTSV